MSAWAVGGRIVELAQGSPGGDLAARDLDSYPDQINFAEYKFRGKQGPGGRTSTGWPPDSFASTR